jgi:hypothetical protein
MFLFDLFRSFLPLHNPIGFGAADFIELSLAALLVFLALIWEPYLAPYAHRLAQRAAWCMLLLAILPVALRLLLLPHHPVPSPDIYDEFSHLLVADTLRHFRLANPPHPLKQFFETFFILQEPTYSSIYPIGQGLSLAIGRAIFGTPWAGVVIATAAFCSLCYWMLRAWVTPGWALLGGMLAVIEFGPLNQWMNNYWGGAVSSTAGCLVFGALPRIKSARITSGRTRDALLLGLGLAIHLLARPFESIFLFLAVVLYLGPGPKQYLKPALVVLPAIVLILIQNHQVTGSWTTLPYSLSQEQYGVPAVLTFQHTPIVHRELTPQQQLDYKMQSGFRGPQPETPEKFVTRLEYRVRYYRFYFLPPLYLALLAFLTMLRSYRYIWIALTLAIFAWGTNFFPAFQFHYVAACVCLFILVSILGLQQISRLKGGPEAARILVLLCIAHFAFWYAVHIFDGVFDNRDLRAYETWTSINHRGPERRIAVNEELAQIPGQLLVFVNYYPNHIFQEEWVFNEAAIDESRVVWARDLGPAENEKLRRYYPNRTALLLEPDQRPPRLSPYQPEPPKEEPKKEEEPQIEPAKPSRPTLHFEPVR